MSKFEVDKEELHHILITARLNLSALESLRRSMEKYTELHYSEGFIALASAILNVSRTVRELERLQNEKEGGRPDGNA